MGVGSVAGWKCGGNNLVRRVIFVARNAPTRFRPSLGVGCGSLLRLLAWPGTWPEEVVHTQCFCFNESTRDGPNEGLERSDVHHCDPVGPINVVVHGVFNVRETIHQFWVPSDMPFNGSCILLP